MDENGFGGFPADRMVCGDRDLRAAARRAAEALAEICDPRIAELERVIAEALQ